MSHTLFVAFALLVIISAAVTLAADYQEPGYDSYQARDYREDKRDPPGNTGPRKGRRRYTDYAYVYGGDKEQRRNAPDSYYEPISV